MKIRDVDNSEILPIGVWRKTHLIPKPVGVELYIKNGKGLKIDKHSGDTHFVCDGKLLQNVVFSYDETEEWLDVKEV